MKKTEIYAAQTDWNEYIAVYNRCMTFAARFFEKITEKERRFLPPKHCAPLYFIV